MRRRAHDSPPPTETILSDNQADPPATDDDPCLSQDHWHRVLQRLGLPPDVDTQLLRQAFSHASFAREASLGALASNQRLEFLGDAVLDLILIEHLYLNHQTIPEGELTKMKASAVRSQALARIAKDIGLGEHLLLGHGEEDTGGRQKASILADCFEALVGAVYLSTDLTTTAQYVLGLFPEVLAEAEAEGTTFDHKTSLQELVQEITKHTPTYETVATVGPPHERVFVVEVRYDDLSIGKGEGRSKQAAQQSAAQSALDAKDDWLPMIGRGCGGTAG